MKNQTVELLVVITVLTLRIKVAMTIESKDIPILGNGVTIMHHIRIQGHQGQGHMVAIDCHMTSRPALIGCYMTLKM